MTMYKSVNGWPASPNPALIGIARHLVPGTGGKTYLTIKAGDVAAVLLYVARRFDAEVDPLPEPLLDDWGYNFRPIRTGTAISNHGSGTAIDLNATDYPMGRRNMSAAQRTAVHKILGALGGVVRWGGDFTTNPDEMHFEIAPGVTAAQVKAKRQGLRLRADGTRAPWPLPWWKRPTVVIPPYPGSPIRLGDKGHPVEALQFAFKIDVNGTAGPVTMDRVRKHQALRLWLRYERAANACGPKTYESVTKTIDT